MGAGIPSGLIGGAVALGLLIGGTWWFGGVLDAKDEAFGDIIELPKDARVAGDRNLVRGGGAMPKQSPAEYEIAPHRKAK